MKISTKGRYGLTIMMELAAKLGEGPTSLKSIAEKNQLSEHYLEQLIAPLRNAGLVKSVRGAYGGYILSRDASEITAGDIIRVLEGPISPVDFTEEDDPAKRDLWLRIRDSIADVLDSTTLESLVTYEEHGAKDSYMFYI
ncbi:cysteine metabolism transcriptional regulator CymR [Paenibacillus brevis]|uniref:Rrf2 family transcriptional regulator n=1 Tax=Paenibacillus brevis TaxID=2841508 RepID=A0ABS6FZ49_9BACL|nr:Rrf2 family transcriptional regulator [Paenibacillus brevis]MBU5674400.1 Rrf2 family transcriptional regulator [Paenibacillus brevis]